MNAWFLNGKCRYSKYTIHGCYGMLWDAMGDIKFLTFGLSLKKKHVGIHYPIYIPL